MKINEFFNHIFYINLDHRIDRKQEFEQEMEKYGISNYTRVPGILATPMEGIALGRTRHIACGTAHKQIVQNAKNLNLDKILIFEDDVSFYNEEEEGIKIIEKSLDDLDKIPHWDLFYLSGLIIDEKLNLVTDNLIKARTVLTTHAYAINSSAYDKILKYNPLIDSAIDGWYGQQSIDNIEIGTLFTKYVAYPLAIHQRFSLSDCDINEEGKSSMGHGLGVYFDCYSKPKIKLF
jgi:GR25 family glycosyltransferase involved in LPS biosynthesis